ncbi:hypothetical protein G6F37_005323 [Rhizopus arrhizus]|nr:hypothetical protein G6F38_001713 [Rhizopus arrhizus]KAG1158962.1 hypothetical protein G6F37_005323 [Rhizopus arrhizus]
MSKVYVCLKAAHAIMADMGSLALSVDGLEAINLFLDEFLFILLTAVSHPVDIFRIKSVFHELLPRLSKHALIEADMELKRHLKVGDCTESSLGIMNIQERCARHCTLSDHRSQSSDIIIIYLTVIVEHIAEYLLCSIADQADVESISLKEVFAGLLNDININHIFEKMKLKDQLQKNMSCLNENNEKEEEEDAVELMNGTKHINALSKNDLTFTDETITADAARKSSENEHRKNSLKRHFSLFNSNHKKVTTHRHQSTQLAKRPLPSPLATDFEDLFRSGDTKRVSLTPHRLKSIEVSQLPDSPVHSPPLSPKEPEQKTRIERTSIRVIRRPSEGCIRGPEKELVYVIPTPLRQPLKSKKIDKACQTDSEQDDEQERQIVEWLLLA